ncbi:uncharacterized protein C16orf46 homolog [Eucyclogobius newberryi]|uniref:uncharacterized protein C16orf46 homolog n=1 Tax=Eucyclogobius newberryi TaxID=166745 RepID=UPI003B59B3B1
METMNAQDSGAAEQCDDQHAVDSTSDTTPDRRHVNVLLELSEEEFMKELRPHEYRRDQGWEEAVCGWARSAPLASLLLSEKADHKLKRAERDSSSSVEPDRSLEQPSETQWRPPTRLRSTISSQHTWASTKHDGPNLTSECPDMTFVDGISRTMAQLDVEDQTRDTRTPFQHQLISKCRLAENKSPKPRKNSMKTSNSLVPIKNFTFLPPINMPQNQQNLSKHRQSELDMENFLIIDKISRIQGTKGDLVYTSELAKDTYNEAVSSKYRTCQHNPHYYSAVSVTAPKRYHVTVSSKPETLHPAGYSMSKALQAGTAANRPSCLYS